MPAGPMRLLLTTDAVGGVWRYSLELAATVGCEVILAVLGPPASEAQRREAAGFRVVETGLGLDWTAPDADALHAMADGLAALARRLAVDVVQLHAPALVGAQAWPAPVVAVAHSDLATWWAAMRQGAPPPEFTANVAASASGLALADTVVAPSRAMAAALVRAHGCARPIEVVHNGRRPLPRGSGPRRCGVLTVGRLWDEAKGAAVLDRAAALLQAPGPGRAGIDAPFAAAGSVAGPNGTSLTLAHLRLLGVLDEAGLSAAMSHATVFASAARYEPFGLSVLEAAQAGLALVLSDIPSLRELWDGAALFVPPGDAAGGDAAGFAAAIRLALAAPEGLAAAAGERALRYGAASMGSAMRVLHEGARAAWPGPAPGPVRAGGPSPGTVPAGGCAGAGRAA